MRTLCYSVRLESMIRISEKAYKAVAFNGSEAIIPACFVYGEDYDVYKCEAWWISKWILERKELQYSGKKSAWFDVDTREKLPEVTYHKAKPHAPVESNKIEELKR